MKILPISFTILTICGFWRPPNFKCFLTKYTYDLFSFLMCFLIYSFTLSHLIDICISANNFEDLTGSCFMLLSMLNVCCKMTNIVYFRKNILKLLNILMIDHCKPQDFTEQKITQNYHKKARFVSKFSII